MEIPSVIPHPQKSMEIPSSVIPHPQNSGSLSTLDEAIEYEIKFGRKKFDPNIDMKKLRRTVSNRLSAQRSRMIRAQYIRDMENMVKGLEEQISTLTPQLECYKEKKQLLQLQNDSLQEEVDNSSNESKIREMELEEKKVEIKRLKEVEKRIFGSYNIKDDSSGGLDHSIRFQELGMEKYYYSQLGFFYQNNLQHQQKQYPNFENVGSGTKIVEPIIPADIEQISCSEIKQKNEEEMKEEQADIDQYLNFDAILSADQPDPISISED